MLLSLEFRLWRFPYHFFIWNGRYGNPEHDIDQVVFGRYSSPKKDYMSFSLVYNYRAWLPDLIQAFKDYEPQLLICKPIYDFIQNVDPLVATLKLSLEIVFGKDSIDSISRDPSLYWSSSNVKFKRANMQPRASVGDGFRVSASSTPSNSSGGSDPDDIESLGDVYIWGEILSDGVSPDGNAIQVPSKMDVLIPKCLESNVVLDVRYIASGTRHIAIVTRQGDVFTWGEESGGRLGHGSDKDSGHPHLVEFQPVTNLDFVACGEYHTCAISKSCELFTWGDGTHNAGLLGHGSEASHWRPKRVNGPLEGLQVVSIACGTWHSALATSNGKLFTFGDGAFGVLGHGDQKSVSYPKEVQLLSGQKTIKVACGVWHTAAIVEVAFQPGSNVSSGKLFTWGDGDKHRLGHGNKETYLQPTRVAPLMEYNFKQVACGHTMTIALTTSGHVFTMGGTENGQLGNPMSIGKIPTLVQDKLLGEFVEEISCGAHHVAVLTSRSELYTWGMGTNGRLGHGDTEDKNTPTLVVALKDRHIKNISCGSNFTSCICIHKWVSGTDQSTCSSCKQAFGLTRKRHNCYNCGLVFCHACSSKKALKSALSPTPEKPHRVCDKCYSKLKALENGGGSKFDRKDSPSLLSINGKEKLGQETTKSTGSLWSPITEPVKYLEIKNSNPRNKDDSTSYVRASQVPSLLQLKDIAFPSALSSTQSVSKPTLPPNPSQTPPPRTNNSRPTSNYTRRQSPPRAASPRLPGSLIDSLRRTNDLLNQEVVKLKKQIQSVKQKGDMQDVEIQKLQRKATEATALAAVESSNHRVTKEFVGSSIYKLKEITEKLPQEIAESKNLRIVLTEVEDFLRENSESEACSLPSKLESKQHNEFDTLAISTGSSKLQKRRLEEKIDVAEVHPCQDGEQFPQESNESKFESKQQNTPDIQVLDTSTSKLEEHRPQENGNAIEVDPCQERGNFHEESNGLKLEYEQQNAPNISTSTSATSELYEHILEENDDATNVDPCQDDGNFIEESKRSKLESEQQNAPNISTSISGTSEQKNHIPEENVDATRVDQSQAGGHVLQKSNGSSISSAGAILSPQNSENGSRSLDSSTLGIQGEPHIVEKFEPGVYVALMLQPDGIKIFKRIKFSKRRFTANQAEEWWNQNKGRVLRKYCPSHQKLTTELSNVKSHAKENIEESPS